AIRPMHLPSPRRAGLHLLADQWAANQPSLQDSPGGRRAVGALMDAQEDRPVRPPSESWRVDRLLTQMSTQTAKMAGKHGTGGVLLSLFQLKRRFPKLCYS